MCVFSEQPRAWTPACMPVCVACVCLCVRAHVHVPVYAQVSACREQGDAGLEGCRLQERI